MQLSPACQNPLQGGAEMNSKQFVKCMRDAGIIDRKLTATSCDLAFVAKAKPLVSSGVGDGKRCRGWLAGCSLGSGGCWRRLPLTKAVPLTIAADVQGACTISYRPSSSVLEQISTDSQSVDTASDDRTRAGCPQDQLPPVPGGCGAAGGGEGGGQG